MQFSDIIWGLIVIGILMMGLGIFLVIWAKKMAGENRAKRDNKETGER